MMTNLEWLQRLEDARFLLTKREQEIVNYIEAHFDALPQLAMEDVVAATNTSRPTVHRFCHKLGYCGFKAFKQAMNQFNRAVKTPYHDFDPQELTSQGASASARRDATSAFDMFAQGLTVDMQALQQASRTLTEAQINRIVAMITQAKAVYCVGYQSGVFPAQFIGERLSRVRKKTHLAIGDQRSINEVVFSITQGDVLLLCEYHKAFAFDLRLCEKANQRGASTILLTDYPTSPVIACAAETLIAHRGLPHFKNSFALPMTVVNCLLLAYEFSLGDNCGIYLQEWEELNS